MDLLNPDIPFQIKDPSFKIYARNYAEPSTFVCATSEVHNSLIAEGCNIYGNINHSIISNGCKVAKNARITDSVIMGNTTVEEGAVIEYAIVGENCTIRKGARIGESPKENEKGWGISVIGSGKEIREGETITANEMI